jgi:hypothetical protein
MLITEFLDIMSKVLGPLEDEWDFALFKDGIIVIANLGDYYLDNVNGELVHERLEYVIDTRVRGWPIEFDIRGLPLRAQLPLRIKYSTLGFMGMLSGSSGYCYILRNGRFLFLPLLVS